MSNILSDNKTIARHLASVFGGRPSVREYLHDNIPLKVDILSSDNHPCRGLISYGTIGLSDIPLKWGDGEFETRIELCGVADSAKEFFPNIIASAAFNIMRSRIVCYPGSSMRDYVKEYYKETKLPHLYFSSPFVWDKLKTMTLQAKKVTWLLCFPISQAEFDFLKKEGNEKFEDLLESAEVDIFDFDRKEAL
jgi:hypothetical protein